MPSSFPCVLPFFFCAVGLMLAVKLIWLVYPETANRHLEDIDRLYREDNSMIFVYKNKDAIQVERPQRFIDADRERALIQRRPRELDVAEPYATGLNS